MPTTTTDHEQPLRQQLLRVVVLVALASIVVLGLLALIGMAGSGMD